LEFEPDDQVSCHDSGGLVCLACHDIVVLIWRAFFDGTLDVGLLHDNLLFVAFRARRAIALALSVAIWTSLDDLLGEWPHLHHPDDFSLAVAFFAGHDVEAALAIAFLADSVSLMSELAHAAIEGLIERDLDHLSHRLSLGLPLFPVPLSMEPTHLPTLVDALLSKSVVDSSLLLVLEHVMGL